MINLFLNVCLVHYLILSCLLFFIGLVGVVVSRNLLRVVKSLLVMSVSIVINFVAFGYYCDDSLGDANIINVFVLIMGVIQSVVAIVILYKIYQANEYLDAERTFDEEE